MRAEYSKHIHHSQLNNKVGVDARVHNRTSSKEQGGQMRGPLLMRIWAMRVPDWATTGLDRTALYTAP